jgi:hypothetical protein
MGRRSWLSLVPACVIACATGGGDADDGGSTSAQSGNGAGAPSAGSGANGGSGDGGAANGSPAASGAGGGSAGGMGGASGMDPDLDLPDPGGQSCTNYGYGMPQCPSLEVCRIAGPNAGRCEGCTSCNNLGQPCVESTDCDILFQCYQGVCTNICPLGTSYCGPIPDCLDVGHATHGVCRP